MHHGHEYQENGGARGHEYVAIRSRWQSETRKFSRVHLIRRDKLAVQSDPHMHKRTIQQKVIPTDRCLSGNEKAIR